MKVSINQQKMDLICCACGNINTILRSEARNLKIFTEINRYCYKCQKQTKQILIEDIDTVKYLLEQKQYLSPNQQRVLDLIEKDKQKIK